MTLLGDLRLSRFYDSDLQSSISIKNDSNNNHKTSFLLAKAVIVQYFTKMAKTKEKGAVASRSPVL